MCISFFFGRENIDLNEAVFLSSTISKTWGSSIFFRRMIIFQNDTEYAGHRIKPIPIKRKLKIIK